MLKAVERPRFGGVAQGGEGGKLDEFLVRAAHVEVQQLVGVEAAHPFHLGNDLVAAPLDGEAVHVAASQKDAEVVAHFGEVETHGGDLVPVENDFRLGDVKFQVGVGEHKKTTLECFGYEGIREFEEFARLRRGGDHKLHRIIAAAGQGGRGDGDHAHARDGGGASEDFSHHLFGRPFALAPRFGDKARKTAESLGDLEGGGGFGQRKIHLVDLLRVPGGLIDGGVGGCLDDPQDDALVLLGGEFLHGEGVEGDAQEHNNRREGEGDGAPPERVGEGFPVGFPKGVEAGVDPAPEAGMGILGAQEPGGHHWGEGQGDDARNHDSAGEGEGEFAEEGTGEAALQTDGGVDGSKGDGHCDERSDQFPGSLEG